MSLLTHTRTGIREMPSNAAWLLSKIRQARGERGHAAESAAAGTRDTGYKARAAIADATPLGGDSVHVRMRRAQDAGVRAKEAEDQAVAAAQESRALSDHARQVSERGRTQMRELEREHRPAGQAARGQRTEGRRRGRAARAPRGRNRGRGASPRGAGGDPGGDPGGSARSRGGPAARGGAGRRGHREDWPRPVNWRPKQPTPRGRWPRRHTARPSSSPRRPSSRPAAPTLRCRRPSSCARNRRPPPKNRSQTPARRHQRRSRVLQQAGAPRARRQHRDRGANHYDQDRARQRHREGLTARELIGGIEVKLRKSRWQRMLDTVNPLDGTSSIPGGLQKLGSSSEWRDAVSDSTVRTAGLIATGLVGLPPAAPGSRPTGAAKRGQSAIRE